jgi:hypothetical protein
VYVCVYVCVYCNCGCARVNKAELAPKSCPLNYSNPVRLECLSHFTVLLPPLQHPMGATNYRQAHDASSAASWEQMVATDGACVFRGHRMVVLADTAAGLIAFETIPCAIEAVTIGATLRLLRDERPRERGVDIILLSRRGPTCER